MVYRTALWLSVAAMVSIFAVSASAISVPEAVKIGMNRAAEFGTKSSPASDWSVDYVDAVRQVGYNVSVAIDPVTGETYISYYEGNDGDLWLARTGAPVGNCGPDDSWYCQALDTEGIVGKYSSIAVGGPGTHASLYITYYDAEEFDLKVIEGLVDRQTGELTYLVDVLYHGSDTAYPPEHAGKASAVEVDSTGAPHVAFQFYCLSAAEWVMYAVKVAAGTGNCGGNDWYCLHITMPYFTGDSIEMDLTVDDEPFIAYGSETYTDFGTVTPCVGCGNCGPDHNWLCHDYSGYYRYISLFVDDDGTAHIAGYNESSGSLEYRIGPDDTHYIDFVGSYDEPAGIAIEQDGNGFPVIAYQDASSDYLDLKIARPLAALDWSAAGNCGPTNPLGFKTWFCETMDSGDSFDSEAYGGLAMATNSEGETTIAYREAIDQSLNPDRGLLKVAVEPRLRIFSDDFESSDTSAWSDTVP